MNFVELKNIRKVFGEVVALDNVDFTVQKGGIHGILGENGAGKTTLMNILYGYYHPDQGEIILEGKKVKISSPHEAIRLGIGMVHQLSTLVPEFTAVENIVLGTKKNILSLSLEKERRNIEKMSQDLGLNFPPNVKVKELSAGVKQKIEIIRALYKNARLIILDEPTTYLVESEFKQLLNSLKTLVQEGITAILITHKLKEVMEACESVTVLRKGRIEGIACKNEMNEDKLVKLMFIEKDIKITESALPKVLLSPCSLSDTPVVSVKKISIEESDESAGFHNISFDIYGGEIFGVASVSGNGEKKLAEVMVNPTQLIEGDILINNKSIKELSTTEVFARGVFSTPEERIREGILVEGTIKENILLGHHNEKRFIQKKLFINWPEAANVARKTIADYNIYTPSEDLPIKRLSGGNIQKVIIGRAFVSPICFLVTHNPTVGLDISSVEFIFKKLMEIRDNCGAVLWVNEDLDELMILSDRIAVLYNGELKGIFTRKEFDKYKIGLMMIGA